MLSRLRHVPEAEPDVLYAVLFGSGTRGTAHAGSDANRAMVARKARALLAYLDWKPVEERCAEGILRVAAARGR